MSAKVTAADPNEPTLRSKMEANPAAFSFDDIEAPWETGSGGKTLEEVLTGLTPIDEVWPGHFYRSPKIKHLRKVDEFLKVVSESDDVRLLDAQEAVIQYMVCVPGDKKMRRVTIEEIDEQFHPDELQPLITRLLERDGFKRESPQGNAPAPTTGAESTGV